MENEKKITFFCETQKGFVLKAIMDTHAHMSNIQRIVMRIDKKGLFFVNQDAGETTLCDVVLFREKFRRYKIKFPRIISFTTKHAASI